MAHLGVDAVRSLMGHMADGVRITFGSATNRKLTDPGKWQLGNRKETFPYYAHMNRIVWTGVVTIVLSLCTLACWTHWSNTRTWTLIDGVPISLAKGSHYSSPELPVNFNTRYFIELYADNRIDSKRLLCMMGIPYPSNDCGNIAGLRVRWVLSGEGASREMTSYESLGARAADAGYPTVTRDLGVFYARKNQRYRLDLYVLSDSEALNAMKPRLYVLVRGVELESNLFWSGLIRVACFGVVIIGVLILVWGISARRQIIPSG
ncbi:MAG: hypothetical protein ACJ71S_07700 [Acidobacteriaceae bacterium]